MIDMSSARGAAQFLEANVKGKLLDALRTGNEYRDAIVILAILSSQEAVTGCLAKIKNFVMGYLRRFLTQVYQYLQRKYYGVQTKKTATIKSITDSKEINTLYDAVFWYANTLVDTKVEDNVIIQTTKNDADVAVIVPKKKTAVVKFKDHDIDFQVASEIVTIHAEREHKREAMVITLSAVTNQTNQEILVQFIDACKCEYEKKVNKKSWKPMIYRNEGDKWVGQELNIKRLRNINTVILKEGQLESAVKDLDKFIKSELWYTKKSIPYTRGYLLYGKPGTGKSSFIQSLVEFGKRSIHYLVLSKIKDDTEMFKLFESIKYDQTVLVLEDVDCVSDIVLKRKNQEEIEELDIKEKGKEKEKEKEGITLSSLLNAIDGGMIDAHGRILVMTTNHIDKLDPALIRSGRIDRKIEFGLCDAYQIAHLYKNYFECAPPGDIQVNKEISPADVAGIFKDHINDPVLAWENLLKDCQ